MTAEEYMLKAQRALSAARLLLDNSEIEGACNRAYYAMFDAAQAALLTSGVTVAAKPRLSSRQCVRCSCPNTVATMTKQCDPEHAGSRAAT